MTNSKKTALLGLMAVSFFLRCETARAIPIPTIGAELGNIVDELKNHVEELKKTADQIKNGIDQAKAMGDMASMDGLKNFAKQQAQALGDSIKSVKATPEMTKAGLDEKTMEDPSKLSQKLEDVAKLGQEDGKIDMSKRSICWNARASMAKQVTLNGMTNSFSLQHSLAAGTDMKRAQDVTSASDDQMQLMGANTATLKLMYQQSAAATALEANRLSSLTIPNMCN